MESSQIGCKGEEMYTSNVATLASGILPRSASGLTEELESEVKEVVPAAWVQVLGKVRV